MPVEFFPFTQWTPSLEHGEKGALIQLENLVPAWGGLRSLPKAVNSGGSPTAPAGESFLGFLPVCYTHLYPESVGPQLLSDNPTMFFSARQTVSPGTDAIAIYVWQNAGWTHLNTYTGIGSTTGAFRYASFGADIWAVTPTVANPQRRTNNAGAFANGVVSATVPSNTRFIGVVRGFMVVANYLDQFWWSDDGDPTNYSAGGSSLAGSGRVTSRRGGLTGFCGGEYGVFFKRNSLHALQFTGGEDIFRLDEISGSIGCPAPSSIIECRDGARRFWGGNAFYEQWGLEPPTKISDEGLSILLLDDDALIGDRELNYEALYSRLWHEDGIMMGFEDPEAEGAIWLYQAGTAAWADVQAFPAMTKGLYYNYSNKHWSTLNLGEGILCAASVPTFGLTALTLGPRFVAGGFAPTGGGAHQRFMFQSSTHYAWTVATTRLALGLEGAAGVGQRVVLKAVRPVLTLNQATLSTDYRLAAVPSNLAVRVIGSSDPHFNQKTDIAGTQVSPSGEQRTMADADEFGWVHFNREAREFLLEISLPESTTAVRGAPGAWVWWEPLG